MLKEIQNIKKESTNPTIPKEYVKQMDAMDEQIRKVSGFLAQQFPTPVKIKTTPPVKKKEEDEYDEVEVEEVEVEVTDDETEEEGDDIIEDEISLK